MRYRRFRRRRRMTPKQLSIRAEIDSKAQRLNFFLLGIGESVKGFYSPDELKQLIDILAKEVLPLALDIEALEDRLYGKRLGARTRKNPKPRKTAQKSAKSKGIRPRP